MTLLSFASVDLPARAVSHGLLAGTAATALLLPNRTLARAPHAASWAAAGLLAALALVLGLVPLPGGWFGRPPGGWGPASVAPELTVTELCGALWVAGVGLLVTVLAGAVGRRSVFERWVIGVSAAVALLGLVHWFGPWRGLFGWIPLPAGVHQHRFAAPFLNANHFGGFLLLGVPTVAARAAAPDRDGGERVLSASLLALLVGMLALVGSTAALGVAALQLVALAGIRLGRPRATAALVGLVVVAGVAWDWSDTARHGLLHGRTVLWGATARLFAQRWLLGAGGGAYLRAVGPHRTDDRFEQWAHAHNDWLEAASEVGLVGLVLLSLAALALRPRPAREPSRSLPVDLGVAGVALHALVDFPLQIPAIAGAVAALWAVRLALHGAAPSPRDPRLVRALVATTLVAQVAAAAWTWRSARVEAARLALGDGQVRPEVVEELRRLAPWSPERHLGEALLAAEDGHPGRAAASAIVAVRRGPLDPDVQRVAALQLLKAGAREEALAAARAAHTLGGWDWRNHVALALTAAAQGDADLQLEAWRAAFGTEGMPTRYYEAAWRAVPVGVVWVDAIAGRGPKVHASLADFLLRKGDAEAAAMAFEQASLTDADQRFPQYVDVLVAQGRLADAEAYADAALAQTPDDRDFALVRARLLEASARWPEAAAAWESIARTHRGVKDGPVRAVRAAEQESPEAAYAMIRRLDASRLGGPALVLEEAAVHFRAGDFAGCASAVTRSKHLDDPKVSRTLRAQAERCRKAAIAATAGTPAP